MHNHLLLLQTLAWPAYKTLNMVLFLRNFPMSPALVISSNELTWHFFMLIYDLEGAGTVSQTLHTSVFISRSSVSSTDCDTLTPLGLRGHSLSLWNLIEQLKFLMFFLSCRRSRGACETEGCFRRCLLVWILSTHTWQIHRQHHLGWTAHSQEVPITPLKLMQLSPSKPEPLHVSLHCALIEFCLSATHHNLPVEFFVCFFVFRKSA